MDAIIANGFEVYAADDKNYDGELASPGAPKGIFFCSTLYDKNLPTKTIYPRPQYKKSFKDKKFPRVAIDIKQLMNVHETYTLYL